MLGFSIQYKIVGRNRPIAMLVYAEGETKEIAMQNAKTKIEARRKRKSKSDWQVEILDAIPEIMDSDGFDSLKEKL